MAHSPVAVQVPGMQVRKPRPPPAAHVTARDPRARPALAVRAERRPWGSPEKAGPALRPGDPGVGLAVFPGA